MFQVDVKAVLAFDIDNHDVVIAASASAGGVPVCLGYRCQVATLLVEYWQIAVNFADTQVTRSLEQQQAAHLPYPFSG